MLYPATGESSATQGADHSGSQLWGSPILGPYITLPSSSSGESKKRISSLGVSFGLLLGPWEEGNRSSQSPREGILVSCLTTELCSPFCTPG